MTRGTRKTVGAVVHAVLAWSVLLAISFPMLWALLTSFRPKADVITFPLIVWPERFTLENYFRIINDTAFVRLFINSCIVAGGTTLFVLAIATLGAYGLTRFRFRGRELMAGVVLFTYFLPSTILVIPMFLTLKTLGVLDFQPLVGLIIAYTTIALPFALWLLRLFFLALPKEVEEAARVDGASRMEIFLEIVLPQALPGIIAAGIFTFIVAFNEYLFSFIFINSEKHRTLPVGAYFIMRTSYEIEWQNVMALSVLMTVPVLIAISGFQRYLLTGFGLGGGKG